MRIDRTNQEKSGEKDLELERALNKMTLPQKPLTDAQKSAVLALALKKAGLGASAAQPGPQNPAPEPRALHQKQQTQAPARLPRAAKRASSILVAAAMACVLGATAFAVGPTLLKMMDGKVDFFEQAPAQSQVANPLDAPRGDYPVTQPSVEAYNAEVNQTVTSNGVTITLDTISMDSATMNAFFTITGDQAVKGALNADDYQPEWDQLWTAAPRFRDVTVNGQRTAEKDCSDFYRQDDSTLKLWCHYQLAAVPQGEEITVQMAENGQAMGVDGPWNFMVTLDGASVRAGGRTVRPGTYFQDSDQPLELTTLTFGPLGGVIGAHQLSIKTVDENGVETMPVQGMAASELLITDDTGKTLFATKDSTGSFGSNAEEGYTLFYNLTAPDAAATALILTPVRYEPMRPEQRTMTTEEMKTGVKIETSPLGGYTVQNLKVEGSVITWELVPYGWNSGVRPVIIPNDDGLFSFAEDEETTFDDSTGEKQTVTALHARLSTDTFDPQTGIYTARFDYCAATPEQLAQITTWWYYYQAGFSLDTARAVTLPLENVN